MLSGMSLLKSQDVDSINGRKRRANSPGGNSTRRTIFKAESVVTCYPVKY